MSKADYLFLLEKVKMLSETVRELNGRISHVEVMVQDNAKTDSQMKLDTADSVQQSQASDTDPKLLIQKMKEQLRKRKPDISSLEDTRMIYKKLKAGYIAAQNNEA